MLSINDFVALERTFTIQMKYIEGSKR